MANETPITTNDNYFVRNELILRFTLKFIETLMYNFPNSGRYPTNDITEYIKYARKEIRLDEHLCCHFICRCTRWMADGSTECS